MRPLTCNARLSLSLPGPLLVPLHPLRFLTPPASPLPAPLQGRWRQGGRRQSALL